MRDTDSTLPTDGRRLENLVFLELLRRSYASDTQLYYYQTRQGYEVDFIERDGNSCKALILAAYSVQDSETLEREKRALITAAQELSCDNLTIVTLDQLPPSGVTEFTEAGKVISVVNLQKFLEL